MTLLYMYRVSCDTGFAPCVSGGCLSLSCCKGGQIRNDKDCLTGIRYWIGSKKDADYERDDVYILGTYHDKFLYLAKVSKVLTMEDYFSNPDYKRRTDNIYDLVNGKLSRNKKLRFKDSKKDIHADPIQQRKDMNGRYVILSNDYIYLGNDACEIDIVKEFGAKKQETKKYYDDKAKKIIDSCYVNNDNKEHSPNKPIIRSCNQK